jgi:hypothetical protein
MRRILTFLAVLAFASALASALDGPLTIGSMVSWLVMFSALFGPWYLFPRQYAEWTRRCRLPRFLRPHG